VNSPFFPRRRFPAPFRRTEGIPLLTSLSSPKSPFFFPSQAHLPPAPLKLCVNFSLAKLRYINPIILSALSSSPRAPPPPHLLCSGSLTRLRYTSPQCSTSFLSQYTLIFWPPPPLFLSFFSLPDGLTPFLGPPPQSYGALRVGPASPLFGFPFSKLFHPPPKWALQFPFNRPQRPTHGCFPLYNRPPLQLPQHPHFAFSLFGLPLSRAPWQQPPISLCPCLVPFFFSPWVSVLGPTCPPLCGALCGFFFATQKFASQRGPLAVNFFFIFFFSPSSFFRPVPYSFSLYFSSFVRRKNPYLPRSSKLVHGPSHKFSILL